VRKKLVFEDILNYNKWVSGIASRELGSQRVTLKDIFKGPNTEQSPNDAKAEPVMPYPLQSVIQQIGELYMNANNAKQLFASSLTNPVIKRNPIAKETVKDIVDKLDTIIKTVQGIVVQANKPVAKKEK
jgi:hypothetical protein